MKLPRNIGGETLIKSLGRIGYITGRQTGSHVRLTLLTKKAEYHLTVPLHNPLRVGTLHSILSQVSIQSGLPFDDLLKRLSL